MNSFLEKLKKGMGIEENEEEEKIITEKKEEEKESENEKEKETKEEKRAEKVIKKKKILAKPQEEKEAEKEKKEAPTKKEDWLEAEGQLMIDFYQTENELILVSPIAGVTAEDLEIEVEGDTLTIRGERKNPLPEGADFFVQECYWGKFSRQVILPVEIDPNQIEATFKSGVLTIKLPKLLKEKKRKIIPK